jgi:predicted RNA-binding protein with TRAM domain
MGRDRYLHTILTIIAGLLLLNLIKPTDRPLATVESTAHAQTDGSRVVLLPTPMERQAGNLRVSSVGGHSVMSLKDVVSLGDGRTFVVSNPNGFVVFQVEPVNPGRNFQ